jgi:FKBP-type peptidyl-prolyl cis-trans isomerase FkpA
MIALLRPRRLVLLALLLTVAACDFGKTSPSYPDQSAVPYSQTDLTIGTGTTAVTGSTVTVQYGAWLYSDTAADHKGMQVDASTTSFAIGAHQVIPGFEQGANGMQVGGTRRVIVPPSLAYGSTGYQTIPPNAALVFDIAMQNVTLPQ